MSVAHVDFGPKRGRDLLDNPVEPSSYLDKMLDALGTLTEHGPDATRAKTEEQNDAIQKFTVAFTSNFNWFGRVGVKFLRKEKSANSSSQIECPSIGLFGGQTRRSKLLELDQNHGHPYKKRLDETWYDYHTDVSISHSNQRGYELMIDPDVHKQADTNDPYDKCVSKFIDIVLENLKIDNSSVLQDEFLISIQTPMHHVFYERTTGAGIVKGEENIARMRKFVDAFNTFITRIKALNGY